MESVEPSDYVCIHCNLRFKNAKSFENHKRKFCQLQKRVIASSLPSARGYDESTNVHTKATLKSLSSDEFWHRKPETSRNGLLVDGKYKDAVFGLNGTSQSFESFSKISADMKFNSVLGDLKTENEKLEEHKRAIQAKLANMHEHGKPSTAVSVVKKRRSQDISNEERREKNIAMEMHLDDLRNSMVRKHYSPVQNGRPQFSPYQSPAERVHDGAYFDHLRKLRRQYIDEGGSDKRIFEMFHGLETDMYGRRQHQREPELEKIIKQLQQQLAFSQQTNASLLKEV